MALCMTIQSADLKFCTVDKADTCMYSKESLFRSKLSAQVWAVSFNRPYLISGT